MSVHLDSARRRAGAAVVTPALVAFLASDRIRDRPQGPTRWLRRIDPVHRSPFGFWVLSGHHEVSTALRHRDLGTDPARIDASLLHLGPLQRLRDTAPLDHRRPFLSVARDLMLFRDPPDHTRLRALVSRAFTPRRMAALEAHLTALADELIGALPARGRFDLMAELAYPFPARVICELLGLPPEDHHLIATHGRALAAGLDPLPSAQQWLAADEAVLALRAHLEPVLADRQAAPRDDLLSDLITASVDGHRLDADEVVATVVLLLIAGHETTANLIGNALVALDGHPAEQARWRAGAVDDAGAVEELLRFEPPVQMTQRIALAPVQLAGRSIPVGSIVILLLGAANRDPAVFEEPDRLVLDREPHPHLAFGAGPHHCLGATLARLEGRTVLPRLLRARPDLRVAHPVPRHRPSFTVRGYAELPVTGDRRLTADGRRRGI